MQEFAEGKTHTSKFANNIQDGGLYYNASIGVSAILSRKICIIDVYLKKKVPCYMGSKETLKIQLQEFVQVFSQLIEI